MRTPFVMPNMSRKKMFKPEQKRKVTLSIEKLGIYMFIVLTMSLLGGAYYSYEWYEKQSNKNQQQRLSLAAETLANQVYARLQSYNSKVEFLANDRLLQELLINGDPEAIRAKEQQISDAIQYTIRVRLMKAEIENETPGDFPQFNFADLEMLATIEAKAIQPLIEAHLLGSPNEHFDVIYPIFDIHLEVIGSLLVSFEADEIKSLLDEIESEGYIEILQGNAGFVLASTGDAALKGQLSFAAIDIPGTRWTAVLHTANQDGQKLQMKFLIAVGIAILLIAIVCFMFTRIIAVAVRHDLRSIVYLTQDLWATKQLRRHYPIRTRNFKDAIELISDLAQEGQVKVSTSPDPTSKPTPVSAVKKPPDQNTDQ